MDDDGSTRNVESNSYFIEELQAKQALLDVKVKEINSLQAKNKEKDAQLAQHSKKLIDYQRAIEERDNAVQLLEQIFKEKMSEFENYKGNSNQAVLQLQHECDEITQQLQLTRQLITEQDKHGDSWRLQFIELNEQVNKLSKNNEDLNEKLAHSERQLQNSREDSKHREKKCGELKKQLHKVTSEWSSKEKSFVQESSKQQQLITVLQSQLEQLQERSDELKLLSSNKVTLLEEQLSNRDSKLEQNEKQLHQLQEEIKCYLEELDAAKANYQLLESKYVKLETDTVHLQKDRVEQEDKINLLSSELSKSAKQILESKENNARLEALLLEKTEAESNLVDKIEKYEEEISKLNLLVEQFSDEMKDNDRKYDELVANSTDLKNILTQYENKHDELANLLSLEQSKVHLSLDEISKLKELNNARVSEIDRLQGSLNSMVARVTELEELVKQKEKLENNITSLTAKLKSAEKHMIEMNQTIKKQNDSLSICTKENETLHAVAKQTKEELNALLKESEKKVNALTNENLAQHELLATKDDELTHLRIENSTLSTDLKQKDIIVGELKHEMNEVMKSVHDTMASLENKLSTIDTLIKTVDLQQNEIIHIKEFQTELENDRIRLHSENEGLKNEKNSLNNELKMVMESFNALKEENEQLVARVAERQNKDNEENKDSTSADVSTYCSECKLLKLKVSNMKFAVRALENENSHLRRHKNDNRLLTDSLSEHSQRNAELLAQLEDVTRRCKQTENELKQLDDEYLTLKMEHAFCDVHVAAKNNSFEVPSSRNSALMENESIQEYRVECETSRSALLTLRQELLETVLASIVAHSSRLCALELAERLSHNNNKLRKLLEFAISDAIVDEEEECDLDYDSGSVALRQFKEWRRALRNFSGSVPIVENQMLSSNLEETIVGLSNEMQQMQQFFQQECEDKNGESAYKFAVKALNWAYLLLLQAAVLERALYSNL